MAEFVTQVPLVTDLVYRLDKGWVVVWTRNRAVRLALELAAKMRERLQRPHIESGLANGPRGFVVHNINVQRNLQVRGAHLAYHAQDIFVIPDHRRVVL